MLFKSKSPITTVTETDPPTHQSGTVPTSQDDTSPPSYAAVAADMSTLLHGDPKELINVPMVHSHESTRLRDALPFSRGRGKVTQTVVVRKMTREHYLSHYAKDEDGKYIGTEKAAVDAGLVFVPSQSSSGELLEQVRKVAFGKEHDQGAFQVGYAMEYRGTESREGGV